VQECVTSGGQKVGYPMVKRIEVGHIKTNSPRVTVNIEGVDVVGLCDTGAEVSLISSEVYEYYLRPCGIKLQPVKISIRSVGGGVVPCRGSIKVTIEICGAKVDAVFLICDRVGESYSCLLGIDVLSKVAEVWPVMYNLCKASVNWEEWKDYISDVRALRKLYLNEDWGFALTGKAQMPVIPPSSMRLVPVWIPQLRQVKSQVVLIEPLTEEQEGWVPEGVVTLPAMVLIKSGKGYTLVANLSKTTN